ncbi:MAG TPA: D-alanyl-D-alanine carboxypeptidase family protein [Gaiellaceae bacterium]
MQNSVLQPVERHRRNKLGKRALPLLALAFLLAAASLVASEHWALAHARSQPAPSLPALRPQAAPHLALERLQAAAVEQERSAEAPFAPGVPLLSAGAPLLEHALRLPLSAPAAILVNARTGAILWARHMHEERPIASTTKIMTGLLAIEHLPLTKTIWINPIVPDVALNREGLRTGERVPVWKLLYGLLLFSGNDDALALAIGTSGSRGAFLELMNEKARELGLHETHFTSPSGVVDRGNYSSAYDLAALTRYAMGLSEFRAIVRTPIEHVKWSPPTYAKTYVNRNQLLGSYPGADGVKTGWTTLAGHCLVASARRGRRSLIAVVLHSTNPYGDVRRLLNFGFANS